MNCRGQAMAEFAVAVAVLVTLLLGMPVISRYHQLQIATIEGARRLAFQSSWRSKEYPHPDAQALRASLFPPGASHDQPAATSIKAGYDVGAAPGRAGQVARVWLAPFRLVAASGFDLHDRALHRADVLVTVSKPAVLPDIFADAPTALAGHYVLLGDDWASFGPEQVARRAGGLLITHSILALRPLLSLGRSVLAAVEPAIDELCPGIVDPERLPADRLGAGPGGDDQPVTRWSPVC